MTVSDYLGRYLYNRFKAREVGVVSWERLDDYQREQWVREADMVIAAHASFKRLAAPANPQMVAGEGS